MGAVEYKKEGGEYGVLVDVEDLKNIDDFKVLKGLGKIIGDSFVKQNLDRVTLTGELSSVLVPHVRSSVWNKVSVNYFPINSFLNSKERRICGVEIDLDSYLVYR